MCVFCEFVADRAPVSFVYRDDVVAAFMTIQPTAAGECLVIPNAHIDHFTDVPDDVVAHIMRIAQRIGRRMRSTFPLQRVGYVVHGYGVAHAHLIIVPQQGPHHLTSDRFVHVVGGEVVFDLSRVPLADRVTLDAHARLLALGHRTRPAAPRGPRLIVVCGLPGAGKTTLATALEARLGAVRLSPDDWMDALQGDLYDETFRARIEALQWTLAKRLLALGMIVVIEWGTWARSERNVLRTGARALGAAVELHHLSAPPDVLFERIRRRDREVPPIPRAAVDRWFAAFQVPLEDELALYDPPLIAARPDVSMKEMEGDMDPSPSSLVE